MMNLKHLRDGLPLLCLSFWCCDVIVVFSIQVIQMSWNSVTPVRISLTESCHPHSVLAVNQTKFLTATMALFGSWHKGG